mmetsp:Transcript_34349/g.80398  ORF Transcript_34349/g.80398 Transcript_34349/m.80398 type:complete len:459 (-) Transcript_34349:105-1481(-)
MGCCESQPGKLVTSDDVKLDEGFDEEEADIGGGRPPEILDVASTIPECDSRPSPQAPTPNGEFQHVRTLSDLVENRHLESSGPSRPGAGLVAQKHWARTAIQAVPENEEALSPTTPPKSNFLQTEGEASGKKPFLKRALTNVAAGHGGLSIIKDFADNGGHDGSGVPDYINKAYDPIEAGIYQMMQDSCDPLRRHTPSFFGLVDGPPDEATGQADRRIRLSNLLRKFKPRPHVMDCKLGVRSFGEEEVHSEKQRPDLYKRMVELDPSAPTPEEHRAQAITKYRWMTFNDKLTTLSSLGFRVDGIAGVPQPPSKTDLKQLQNVHDIAQCIIKFFLPLPVAEDGSAVDDSKRIQLQKGVALEILLSLKDLRETLMVSPLVQGHSIIGSSLLFVVDQHGPDAGVFLIDFAKTLPVPAGISIDHRRPWVPGNHEDGLLLGVANMISCWEKVLELLSINLKLC